MLERPVDHLCPNLRQVACRRRGQWTDRWSTREPSIRLSRRGQPFLSTAGRKADQVWSRSEQDGSAGSESGL